MKRLTLPSEGALVTEKLAKLLGVSVGDSITLENDTGDHLEIPVAGIVESYILHDVFITPEAYARISSNTPVVNSVQVKLTSDDQTEQETVASRLMENDNIVAVSFVSEARNSFNQTLDTLNIVTIVLVVAAAMLAFIVLYSLTNINVSERIRELSTIKVLGAYPREVTMYIYRGNPYPDGSGNHCGCLLWTGPDGLRPLYC